MNTQSSKFQVAVAAVNLGFWIWVVSHMKQHGDYLGGPNLYALIGTAIALLICYRSVLAARQG